MKLSAQEFLGQPRKAITLMGMSGVGKSFLAHKLAGWGWHNYSCDDLIGTKYLGAGSMTVLSEFVGQIGGGVGLKEFRSRQQRYYEAECAVLRDMGGALAAVEGRHFVNDSSGSLCEIEDETILAQVGKETLLVYLKVPEEKHAEILQRSIDYPKPLYFPPKFFDAWLAVFMQEIGTEKPEDIDSEEFLRWVFPDLFESRLPKYQRLADLYGVTVSAERVDKASSAEEFLAIVAEALDG